MIDLGASDVRPFLPSKDFELSKRFYAELGCKLEWSDDNLSLFNLAGFRFYLQHYYTKEWADNCMLHIAVQDATSCFVQVSEVIQSGLFPGARVSAPKHEPYGALVTYVWDPVGVLLHLAEWNPA